MLDNLGYVSLFFFVVSILFFIMAAVSRRQSDQGADSAQITIAIILLALSIITLIATLVSRSLPDDDSFLFLPVQFIKIYVT